MSKQRQSQAQARPQPLSPPLARRPLIVLLSLSAGSVMAADDVTLPVVKVQAPVVATSPAYAGGQIATGSRVGMLGNRDFTETPFSTISYTDSYVADRQAKDITSVIAATDPSVFSNGVTGTWSENYAIRGFSTSTGDAMLGGLYGMAPYYRTSPEMFERIEVFKGPSALLNGMPPGGSVGGTVNLVPKRAAAEPLTRLSASYTPSQQWGSHLDVGRRFGEAQQLGVRFNAALRDGEGAVKGQAAGLKLAALGLDWQGDAARVFLDLYNAEDRVDGPVRGINLAPGLGVPAAPAPDTLLNPPWAAVENHDKGMMLRGELDLGRHTRAYAAVGISKTRYQYNGATSAQLLDTAGTLRTTIGQLQFELDKKSAEAGVQTRLKTGVVSHQLTLNTTYYEHHQDDYGRRSVPGADWLTNLYRPTWGAAAGFVAPPIARSALRLRSIGLADTLSMADDRIQLTLGVRRQQVISDSFNVSTGALSNRYDASATTPGMALLVKVSDQVSLYANRIEGLGQGAKAPLTAANAGEVFAPYKTRQSEAGLKYDHGSFAHTLSVYRIERPSSYTDPVSNVFSFGGEQRNQGVEWNLFGQPLHSMRVMGGLAYVNPKLTRTAGGVNQGKQATGVAKHQAKLGVEYDLDAVAGLTIGANATAVSRQYISADNSLYVGGRTLFDLSTRYVTKLDGKPLTLRAAVNNVTNKAYWGMPQLSSLALGAPRTFSFSASLDL